MFNTHACRRSDHPLMHSKPHKWFEIKFQYHVAQLYGGKKYWQILRIDCHSPMFYLPILFLTVIYSIGAYFDNVVRKLLTLSCCYNKM